MLDILKEESLNLLKMTKHVLLLEAEMQVNK